MDSWVLTQYCFTRGFARGKLMGDGSLKWPAATRKGVWAMDWREIPDHICWRNGKVGKWEGGSEECVTHMKVIIYMQKAQKKKKERGMTRKQDMVRALNIEAGESKYTPARRTNQSPYFHLLSLFFEVVYAYKDWSRAVRPSVIRYFGKCSTRKRAVNEVCEYAEINEVRYRKRTRSFSLKISENHSWLLNRVTESLKTLACRLNG